MTDTSHSAKAVLSYQVCTTLHEMFISNPIKNIIELSCLQATKITTEEQKIKNHLHHALHTSAGGQD